MKPTGRIPSTGSAPWVAALLGPSARALAPRGMRAALLAAVALVLAGLALWPAPADAQEPAGPVWSADMTVVEYTSVSTGATSADLFSNVGGSGYPLGSVGIQVSHFLDGLTVGAHLWVTINGVATDGEPDAAHCPLTNPSSFPAPGVIIFEAPAGEGACPQLAAETTHFVVIEWVSPSRTAAFALIPQTYPSEDVAANKEDPGGAEGWSIADQAHYLTAGSDAGSGARTWSAYGETASFKIQVKEAAVTAARANSPATGAPGISGTVQAGQTLTADTSGIADEDGLENVSYSCQWIRSDNGADADIAGERDSTYTLVLADLGKTIKVRVTFTDDADNEETRTSEPTGAVAARPVPLTATFGNIPASHGGSGTIFTFDLAFSENPPLSYKTPRGHAFMEDDQGSVVNARRKVQGSNRTWTITVEPSGSGGVTVALPGTTGCNDAGAICTGDGRMLSNSLSFTVSGPDQWVCRCRGQNDEQNTGHSYTERL